MTWAIQLSGDPITEVAELTSATNDNFSYYLPQDIEVDNSTESNHFGNIYIANPQVGNDGMTTHSKTQKAGIYVFDPLLNLKNRGNGYKPSNLTLSNSWDAIHRIAINPTNGFVSFAKWDAQPFSVYSMDLTASTIEAIDLLDGFRPANIKQPVALCYEDDGTLCLLSFKSSGVYNIYKIKDGEARQFIELSNRIANGRSCIASDGEGGFWIVSWKDNTNANLHHVTSSGIDLTINLSDKNSNFPTNFNRGQLAYDTKNKVLALGGSGSVQLYHATYTSSGPELEKWVNIQLTGNNVDGLAFDYAGNLYAASASVERFYAFTLPTENNTCTTPAKSTLTVSGAVPEGRVYAYDLDMTEEENSYIFSFKANENANSGSIILYNGKNIAQEYTIDASITKGTNVTHSISKAELPKLAAMTWAVKLNGEKIEQLKEYSDDSHKFYFPQGIATNTNPESNHFGKIYVANAQGGKCSGTSTIQLDGIYEYSPVLALKNPNAGYKPSGLSLPDANYDAIHRIAVDPINDYVVFAKWNAAPYVAYGMNPDNMTSEAVNLSEGIVQPTAICYDKEGALCAVSRDDVQGDKSKRTYSIQRKTAQGLETIYSQQSWLTDGDNSIASDGQGGFWVVSYSKNNSNVFAHITKNKDLDFSFKLGDTNNLGVELPTNFNRGQLAYDLQRNILALGGGGKVTLYNVAYDATGKASLTKWLETPMYQSDRPAWNTDGIAFDYAGNLLVASASSERFYAFALPTENNTCTTPAKKSLIVNGINVPRVMAYDLRSELVGEEYKLSFETNTSYISGNIVFYDLDGNMTGNKLPITANPMTINRNDLPENIVNWGVELTAAPIKYIAELTDNSNDYKFYCPQGIAIDNSTESDYFGKIYVAQATKGNLWNDATSEYTKTQKVGIYQFSPTLEYLNPTENEGIVPNGTVIEGTSRNDIHRIAINPKNHEVAFAYNLTPTAVWSVSQSNINGTATNLVGGMSEITLANSLCFDENGALYVMNEANETNGGKIYKITNGQVELFADAQADKWVNPDNSLVSDGRGGLWIAQHRFLQGSYPILTHVNKTGNTDYVVKTNLNNWFPNNNNASYRGHCAYNPNENVLAFGGNNVVTLFRVTYEGETSITEKILTTPILGTNIDGIAFDYAGNLYVASASTERFYAYTIPTETNTCVVPAKKSLLLSKKDIVTIDDNANNSALLNTHNGASINVNVTRNFTASNYMTLTLPFDMNATQIQQVFGNNATVFELVNVVKGEAEIHLQFSPTSSIIAGTPYILDIDADVNGFIIDNVVIDTELRPKDHGAITMVPVLDCDGSKLEQPTQYWLATDNYLYSAGAYPTNLLGLRAYFQSTSPLPVRARVVYNDNETTGLPIVEQPSTNVRKIFKDGQIIIIRGEQQYNIQGQRMQ